MIDARALKTDAALKAEVTAAQTALTANANSKLLQDAALTAKAAVASTTDVAVLTNLQTALTAYLAAGGKTTASLGADTVGDLVDLVNGVLGLKVGVNGETATTIAAAQKALVEDFLVNPANTASAYTVTNAGGTETAAEKALKAAITATEARDKAYDTSVKADAALASDPDGFDTTLVNAQTAVTVRDSLIKASTDAAAAVVKEQADLVKVTAAFDAHATSEVNLEAASKAIADLGYATTGAPTAAKDLFVADIAKVGVAGATTITAGFAAGDELFIGTQYKFGGATDATHTVADLFTKGSASALEVYFQQDGANTIVHVEAKAFANAAAVPAADIAQITLTGVTASTLTFENGFVHVA